MPTASKLFGGFAFMLVGFFAAEMLKPQFPEGYNFGRFPYICAGIGLLVGWIVMRRGALESMGQAISAGLRASFLLLFWGMLFFSCREMIIRSIDRRYKGVMEALEGTFDIMIEYGELVFASANLIIVLVVGGILGGMFVNWAALRWR